MKTLAKVLACIVVVLLAGCGQDVEPGQVWLYRHDPENPFRRAWESTNTVIAVKDGWVQFLKVYDDVPGEYIKERKVERFTKRYELIKEHNLSSNVVQSLVDSGTVCEVVGHQRKPHMPTKWHTYGDYSRCTICKKTWVKKTEWVEE